MSVDILKKMIFARRDESCNDFLISSSKEFLKEKGKKEKKRMLKDRTNSILLGEIASICVSSIYYILSGRRH